MVKKITTPKNEDGYMDGFLLNCLDIYKKDVLKKDDDCCIIADGLERSGKCQRKGSKVLMADGMWKKIEDIKIGDEVISPQIDGTTIFTKVVNTSNWFCNENYDVVQLNKAKKKLYSCSYNHQIPFNFCSTHRKGKGIKREREWKIRNITARDYINFSNQGVKKNATTLSSPEIKEFKGRENCKIEPYSLGVWLGDGHFRSIKYKKLNENYDKPSIVKRHLRTFKSGKVIWQREHLMDTSKNKKEYLSMINRDVGITSGDFEIIQEVSKFYPIQSIGNKEGTECKTYRFSLLGEFSKLLSELGLEGKGSGTKFIPKEALLSSSEYRKRVLAGLIDTDGYYHRGGYAFTLKSKKLVEDIRSLVYSLGGRCGEISKVKKGIRSTGFVGEYYSISCYLGRMEIPLQTKRKKHKGKYWYLDSNRISIDVVPSEPSQVYGIEIDSKSKLYITDNWMVTHNSTVAYQVAKYLDPTYNLSRCVFTPDQFFKAVVDGEKGQAIVFDEAHGYLNSRQALSKFNKSLIKIMAEMGFKNLFVIIILPSFFELDKYPAIHRSRALISVHKGKRGEKGYFKFYNYHKKKILYLKGKKGYNYRVVSPNFYGRFTKRFYPNKKEYNEKKHKAIFNMGEKIVPQKGEWKLEANILIHRLIEGMGWTLKMVRDEFSMYGREITEQGISKRHNGFKKKFANFKTQKIEVKTKEKGKKTNE